MLCIQYTAIDLNRTMEDAYNARLVHAQLCVILFYYIF